MPADATAPVPITPVPTPTSQPFWDGLADGRVMIQRCGQCETWVYYPRARCPQCLSDDLEWNEVSGVGVIYTFTVARQPTTPAFAEVVDPIIAVVELDEGVRITTSIEGATADEVEVGMRVGPVFVPADDGLWLLRHQPVAG